jgi:hypothetical protein
MPKIEMKPTAADTLNGMPVTSSARIRLRQATGTCAMMMNVSIKE